MFFTEYQSEEELVFQQQNLAIEANNCNKSVEGERRLLTAILYQAIKDLESSDTATRLEVTRWFIDKETTGWGSFIHICDILNICPLRLKKEIHI